MSELVSPHECAALVGIERVRDRGLLRHHQEIVTVDVGDGRRRGEVIVGAELLRACRVRAVGGIATHRPLVCGRDLLHPSDSPGIQIHGHDRIRHRLRRIRVAIAGPDVDEVSLGIDGRRGPDPAAGGTERLHALLRLAARLALSHGVSLPEHSARVGIQRRDVATEGATRIFIVRTVAFLPDALHRDEDTTVEVGE